MTDEIKPIKINTEAETEGEVKPGMETGIKTSMKGRLGKEETAVPIDKTKAQAKKKMVKWVLGLVILGTVSGYGLFRLTQPGVPKRLRTSTEGGVAKGDTFGVMDEEAFRDEAEGEIASGGVDGEGSHHLIRGDNESQYVYLTSSIIDLDQFVDRKVKVWGETFEAQVAGWLMDVGRLEVLE